MKISVGEMFPTLSPRQREICVGLIEGKQNKVIARDLGISPRTVEDHRAEIFRRTGSSDVRQLVYKALGEPEVVA